jgi:predicted RNA-binding Zn ribbon-like protein
MLMWRLYTAKTKKTKLNDLSPRANNTDRASAACRRSDCQLFADRGYHVVSVTDPYGCILGFLDRSRYFSIK